MITLHHPVQPADVANHYDRWDSFYRTLWGDHLHHGYWDDLAPDASIEVATRRLVELLLAPLPIHPGDRVLDIGCGYGATTHRFAEMTGAVVTGITVSPRQAQLARLLAPPHAGRVEILEGDWMTTPLPEAPFAHALAIESLSHMPDKRAFFVRLHESLATGGNAVISCWVAAPRPSPCERVLLSSICRDGSLPSLGSWHDYHKLMRSAGLHLLDHRDLTEAVAPTWPRILQRSVSCALRSPSFLASAILRTIVHPRNLTTLPKMILAMHGGALRYHAWWLRRDLQ